MACYAQFFQQGGDGSPVEACGDRGIVRLDGRWGRFKMEQIAEDECRKRNYIAWQLIRGESLLRAVPVSPVVSLFM